MTLKEDVKLALRITSAAYDSEVDGLIAAARSDLKVSGVSATAADAVDPEPLVKMAITVYCKANFGLDNPDSEKFMASYLSLETALSLSDEYKEAPTV